MTSRATLARRITAALAAAFAAALAAYAATLFAFFLVSGASAAALVDINTAFLPGAVVFFVLYAVASFFGVNRRWYTALSSSLVAAIVASILGTMYTWVAAGNAMTSAVFSSILETVIGQNLILIVFAVIAAVTIAPVMQRVVLRYDNRQKPGTRNVALVRLPAASLADGEVTHIERTAVNIELADQQWDAYVAALAAAGFETIEVAASEQHPDSVFIEDTTVILGTTAVITSPGAETRRGEQTAVEATLVDLGLDIERIELPGTFEGGDVLKINQTIYVGRGGRTNAEGIRQFRAIANRLGYTVVAVPVSKVLHLKSAVTALPDGTVIGYAPLVEHPELFDRFLAVPEEAGAAVVVLADDAVLMSSAAPLTAELLVDLDYRVVTVDISEFEKLEGCVTCLSVRVR